ncbi:type VI secretion system baseplate subunit TssK [Paraburkholderia sediminicola]|uniref:type VI secretion system baseplate subunit TssK n=1 Tax=Paraburkholderia sediminicola TaxID=458836 RepID=UPI0038B81B20
MNADQPVHWYQGLYLQPQHLQHTDRLNHRRIIRHREIDVPHNWGIVNLSISEAALGSGRFVPEQLSVVFRDGTLVEFPGNALIEPRAFAPAELVGAPRTVYVGLRELAQGRSNIGVFENLDAATQSSTRFATLADPETMPDLLTAEGEAGVRVMHYVLRLFWDTEIEGLGGYELLPLARIEREGDSTRLSPYSVAPALHIGASVPLLNSLRDVRDELTARAKQLEVFKQPAGDSFSELDPSQWRGFQAMLTMNRYVPLFEHLIETPQVHPWEVYGVLRQLVGELSAFSLRCDAIGLAADGQVLVPSYRHEECGNQIAQLATLIAQLLNEIALGPEQIVRFTRVNEFWHAEMTDVMTGARNRYYLVINGRDLPDTLAERAPLDCKLGATGQIDRLVTLSLPGVELLALPSAPMGMPRRQGAAFFRIESVSDSWQSAIQERSVSLFYPELSMLEAVTIELAIVRK